MLTNRYLHGIPADSRAAKERYLSEKAHTEEKLDRGRGLNVIAEGRGQTLAQMAITWIRRDQPKGSPVTSALVGASSVAQLEDTLGALEQLDFSKEEPWRSMSSPSNPTSTASWPGPTMDGLRTAASLLQRKWDCAPPASPRDRGGKRSPANAAFRLS
jgi:aryl-alcohol dehydrogenase-like predicted oxidoreductase